MIYGILRYLISDIYIICIILNILHYIFLKFLKINNFKKIYKK